MQGGVTLVHAEQVAGKDRCFVAAGAGTDFQDCAALVHRILRQQRDTDAFFERLELLVKRGNFGLRHIAHFRIIQHGLEIADLGLNAAPGLDFLDHRREFRKFAGQFHELIARKLLRQFRFDGSMARHKRFDFMNRQHVYNARPSASANAVSLSRIERFGSCCATSS